MSFISFLERRAAGLVLCSLLGGCFLTASFDRFDPDAPNLVGGDAGVIEVPGDAEGPFVVRVTAPPVIDGDEPGTIVVHVERTGAKSALRARLVLPPGMIVEPGSVDIPGDAADASFRVDVSRGPRGDVKGAAEVTRPDGSAGLKADFTFKTTGPGDLDPTFGAGGVVVVPASGPAFESTVRGFASVDDERLLLSGYEWLSDLPSGQNTKGKVARITSSGLDPTFATGGFFLALIGDQTHIHRAMSAAGETWITGFYTTTTSANPSLFRQRFTADGAFLGGKTIATVEADPPSAVSVSVADGAWVAGWDNTHFDVPLEYKETVVAKLGLDDEIAIGPVRNRIPMVNGTSLGEFGVGADKSPGDLVLVGGRLIHTVHAHATSAARPTVVRLAAYSIAGASPGTLDAAWGVGGVADEGGVAAPECHVGLGIAPRADGSVVVAGAHSNGSIVFAYADTKMLVTSFTKDGVHDPTVSNPLAECQGTLFHATVDDAGRSIVVGYYGEPDYSTATKQSAAIVRLRADGSIDTSFGSNRDGGRACDTHPGIDSKLGLDSAAARRVMIDSRGRILVAGDGWRPDTSGGTQRVWWVARFRR